MSSRKIYLKFVQFWNICRILFLYTRTFFMRGIKVKIIDGYSISTNIESIEAVVQRCSAKKVFLEISQIFTGKRLCQSLFFRLWHRCFPVNFAKFLRKPFYIEHLCFWKYLSLNVFLPFLQILKWSLWQYLNSKRQDLNTMKVKAFYSWCIRNSWGSKKSVSFVLFHVILKILGL